MRVGNIVGMHGRMVFTRPIEDADNADIKVCADCNSPSKVLVIETAPSDIKTQVADGGYSHIRCWGWCMNCDIGI